MKKKQILLAIMAAFIMTSGYAISYEYVPGLGYIAGGGYGGSGGGSRCSDRGHEYYITGSSYEDGVVYKNSKCSECGDTKEVEAYTFKKPGAILEINSMAKQNEYNVIDNSKKYFEQGVILKEGDDKNYVLKMYEKYDEDENEYAINESVTVKGTTYSDSIEYDLTSTTISELSNASEEIVVPQTLGEHTLKITVEDDKPGETASATAKFNVGPYPTIYYNATLQDSNNDSHIDTLSINGIKMTCTYLPQSVTFELYNKHGQVWSFRPTVAVNGVQERTDDLGYNVTIDSCSHVLDRNINPMDDYYLMVIVNDGRTGTPDTTTPNRPKYAKFGSVGF